MSPFEATVRRTKRDLNAIKANWAFVGGVAVSTYEIPRFTYDVDVAVAVGDDASAERVVQALTRLGYQVIATLERDDGRLATVRLRCPEIKGTEVVLDLLFATCGLEPEVVARARTVNVFPSFPAPVAHLSDLIAMKLLSVGEERAKDDGDLRGLLATASEDDIAQARQAAEQIMSMGLGRGRDLRARLDEYVRRSRSGDGA